MEYSNECVYGWCPTVWLFGVWGFVYLTVWVHRNVKDPRKSDDG